MKIGLTVGKFAPLHKGHQYLIETALNEVDQLIVIIYEALDIPELSIELRVGWLKMLYPDLIVIVGDRVPKDKGYTEEIQQKHEDYILSLVEAYTITYFYSSESYGDRMSDALNCPHRKLDPDRKLIPISASKIREDITSYKHFTDHRIYKDLQLIYK